MFSIPKFFSLLFLISVSHAQNKKSTQIHKIDGNVSIPLDLKVDKFNEFIVYYKHGNSPYPFRVKVSSANADTKNPVVVVIRQENEVISWTIPVFEKTAKGNHMLYNVSSRTLCQRNFASESKNFPQEFILAISSYCDNSTDVHVEIEKETSFFVKPNEIVTMSVSPSQSRYIFSNINDYNTDTLTVRVASPDDACLLISIQKSECPVFYSLQDITYRGQYQTISRKGAFTIRKKDFPQGFFLIFNVLTDNFYCLSKYSMGNYKEQTSELISNVSFTISKGFNREEYFKLDGLTLAAFVVICLIAFAIKIICSLRSNRRRNLDYNLVPEGQNEGDDLNPRSAHDVKEILDSPYLYVRTLAKHPEKNYNRSFNYTWHTMSIAIFYTIPAVQLLISYQKAMNSTGNQDSCYYNFLCAHPLFVFSDFNHISSNIGYIIMGMFFILDTFHRQKTVPFRYRIGIPGNYGHFYAMGVAMILEGLLSLCYHICPSQADFQFDLSFMYIMIVLCMVNLYQNRHPDLTATAYKTFSFVGFGILCVTILITYGNLFLWMIFIVGYFFFCLYVSFKIYFVSFSYQGLKRLSCDIWRYGFGRRTLTPIKNARFIALLSANVLNTAILIFGTFKYTRGTLDFGSFVLYILLGNAVCYIGYYIVMKRIYRETLCKEAIVFGVLGFFTWIAAGNFFSDSSTDSMKSPAESRQLNQECFIGDYYDKHDVWHFLSSLALYFTFKFLICIDDDLINKDQAALPVF